MQNFPNSPAPPALPPGFTSRGGGGSSYPPQSTDPQISPRMTDDYTGMQQQTPPNPQSHSRHLLHRGHHHPSQAGHMLAYDARNRAGESSHGNIHSGSSSNPYQKETMDYYFAMGGKDRHRRGGMAYGAGFGYSNMDGHIPQQYRQAGTSSGLSSGMMSPYPLDYGSTAGSGGSSSGSSGAGAFSPSHQYKMGQNPAMQPASGPQMQHRQHGQNYPAHQALQHGQQHRTYPISGHRMPPQFSHYSPQGSASTGSSGMYSSPPQRYHDGASSGGGFEPKVNNSPNMNSNSNSISSSATTNNVGSLENVTQSYHSSSYPSYSPQTHPLHKQATLQHRNSQHNLGIGYDNSLKMQHHAPPPGSVYSKHHQSTNPGMPQQPCQEIAKSPMHSQPQQGQINQNFSPISNPSPAASAVQSPSCSSSPSPLMGVSEGHGNPSCPPHVPSHPPPPNPRSCRGRLLQTMPQLSPTPNSNSSISSCGSNGSNKATGLNTSAGGGHSVKNRSRMAAGTGKGSHEEGSSSSVYSSSPLDKLMQDPGLNSLNALTSQVANLPNTVQHMLLTDTLMSHRRGKDGQSQMLQALQAIPSTQPRSRSVSAASSSGIGGGEGASSEAGGDEDSFLVSERVSSRAKEERDEQISEGEKSRMRQMSGTSSGSEPTGYYPPSQSQMCMGSSKNQSHTGKSDQGSKGKMMFTESSTKQSLNPSNVSERKTTETRTPSLSSPSSAPQSAEPGPSVHSRPPVSSTPSCPIPSPAPQFHPNCVSEPGATDVNTKNGLRKTREIKYEGIKDESGGMIEKNEKGTHGEQTREGHMRQDGQDKENKLDRSSFRNKKGDEKDGKRCKTRDLDNSNQDQNIEEQPNVGGVGVIVSTRCEVNNPEKATHAQDNCIEEKHSDSFFRESSRHNGEEGMDLSVYSSHHEVPQKSNFARSVPQNHPPSGPQKYGYQESPHGAAMGLKTRGRPSPGSVTGSNSRYQGFHQPKASYGPEHTKDVAGTTVEGSVRRREGSGARGHDDNSQLQHQFPSLLQEVLQGYHLDRRYGRSEQALTAHLQAQNMTRQQYQTRHPYGMAESMRTQTGVGEVTSHPSRMTSPGKPLQLNQRQGPGSDFVPESPQSSLKSEGEYTKGSHSASSEKNKMATLQRHPTHMPQSTEFLSGPPPKHINLADYSLPHRKTPSGLPSSSSAVQELLLQETEPLAGSVGTIGQIESQMLTSSLLPPSKERRSVICDVCPNRRSTPERDGERERVREKSPIGASVIQLPSTNDLGNSKEMGDKKEVGMKVASKETAEAVHHSVLTTKETDVEHHNKALHPSVVMNAEPLRRGKIDLTTTMPSRHLQQTSHYPSTTNPLSPPSRRQSYPHGVDLSTGHASGFPGSRFGDTREGNMMPRNPHFQNPYHSPQVQLQNPQSANKLQMYTHLHAHDLDDRLDWAATINRPTKDMMQSSTSPGRHKLSHSEQRQRMPSPTDILHNRQPFAKQQVPHQNTYYDMKMWESTHSGRESVGMLEGDPYQRSQQPPPAAPLGSVAPQLVPTAPPVSNILESPVSRVVTEEIFKSLHPTPTPNSMKTVGHSIGGNVNSVMPQSHRPNKTGGSGDTNPLMLRRRVRSFISPIPAKRPHQDVSQQRSAPSSYHSPLAYSESSLQNDDDSSSSDITTLGSPNTPCPTPGQSTYSQSSSPVQGKKSLPPRKGRGLKLEAIVQKITPNVKKSTNSGHADVDSNDFAGFSHTEMSQFTDTQDEEECLPYLDESLSLSDIMPYRGVDETGPLPPTAYPCDPHQTSQVLKRGSTGTVTRPLQPDFDFGLGTAASSTGDRDKEIPADFTLLGPLPPPPPLPCPVQGSPPPSSSALSDIQHFTNTYQQLETRRGEQSAANLLRQKLEETGIGFDDYSSSDYYGTTPPHHSQAQGHLLRQPHQTSPRSSLAMTGSPQDSKQSDNSVPKGYFPSGKKKGRPVGSVNKQKRAQATQAQAQNASPSALSGPPIQSPATVSPQVAPSPSTTASAPSVTPPTDQKMTPEIPPVLTQAVKVDAESEDTQPETEVKSVCQKQEGVKDESEVVGSRGRQRRRRRGVAAAAAKDDLEAATRAGEHFDNSRVFPDNGKCAFAPYIHVERKVAEIGAVCTIVNGEEEKMKGERGAVGGKASSSGIEALLTSALLSQLPRRDGEIERVKEKRELEDVDSALQAGKVLPSSEYLLPGPVITESIHSGRLLCCLCQKWANFKNLGDLYGPYYPPEYATRLPKNQPQIRQSLVTTGMSRNVQNLDTISNVLTTQGPELQDVPTIKSSTYSDCMFSQETNTTSPATAVGTASPAGGGEMLYLASKLAKTTTNKTTVLNWDMPPELKPVTELRKQPELQNDPTYSQQNQPCQQQQTEDTQQRPQHRKLTSHPRFKRRQKSSEDSPRMVPSNSKASLPFQPPPPTLDSLGPLAQLAQLPQMPMDPKELWVHEACMVWTSGVYLVNGRLYGLQEALDGARDTVCSYCEMVGSTLGCYSKGCTLRYHYLCAMDADCSLNEDNFSLRCPKHKVKRESLPRAASQLNLCTLSSLREAERDTEEEETQEYRIGMLGR